jgi:hypothetical protein
VIRHRHELWRAARLYSGRRVADSPLGRLAQDPLGTLTRWGHQAARTVLAHLPVLIPAVLAMALLAVAAGSVLARWRHRRLADGARVVGIRVPPQVDVWRSKIGFWSLTCVFRRPGDTG